MQQQLKFFVGMFAPDTLASWLNAYHTPRLTLGSVTEHDPDEGYLYLKMELRAFFPAPSCALVSCPPPLRLAKAWGPSLAGSARNLILNFRNANRDGCWRFHLSRQSDIFQIMMDPKPMSG
jgi:hypothetical protein